MIYFIVDGGDGEGSCVKIGYSKNPPQRVYELQVGNPKKLDLLCEYPGSELLEGHIHKLFSDFHIRGEWFWYNESSADLIRRLSIVAVNLLRDGILGHESYLKRMHSWVSIQQGRKSVDAVMVDIENSCAGWV